MLLGLGVAHDGVQMKTQVFDSLYNTRVHLTDNLTH